jgi:hypothetical protein
MSIHGLGIMLGDGEEDLMGVDGVLGEWFRRLLGLLSFDIKNIF